MIYLSKFWFTVFVMTYYLTYITIYSTFINLSSGLVGSEIYTVTDSNLKYFLIFLLLFLLLFLRGHRGRDSARNALSGADGHAQVRSKECHCRDARATWHEGWRGFHVCQRLSHCIVSVVTSILPRV